MPRRTDITSVLVIGSGPIVIGQACEFDYSGTQACRVLKEEGLRVILVNSNPATIMTDPEFADATYVEPITTEVLTTIIAKERPDAILPTLGGQTALNAAIALDEAGVLEKYDVELIGANIAAIQKGEDREQFKEVVEVCGAESARSAIVHTIDDALAAVEDLGYPVVVRPSFTMGGLGSGIAYDETDLRRIVGAGPALLADHRGAPGGVDPRLEGVRARAHARQARQRRGRLLDRERRPGRRAHRATRSRWRPALTLTDREYQRLRDIGIAVIREVGVDTGGCNIQFAVEPATGRDRRHRDEPARLALLGPGVEGDRLPDRQDRRQARGRLHARRDPQRHHGGSTPASFEPTLDYVVVKVPRFAFEKFPAADDTLTTTMKSVGEAMALGRNFTEALGKAHAVDRQEGLGVPLGRRRPDRRGARRAASRRSAGRPSTASSTCSRCCAPASTPARRSTSSPGIDPWFLDQIQLINEVAAETADAPAL